MIALPPFDDGAVQLTFACALPATALTAVGDPGTIPAVTTGEVPAGPVPLAFTAATWKVYAVPLLRPVMVADVGVGPTLVAVWAVEPMYGVIVYPVIALPPFEDGAFHVTVAWALPPVAVTAVGAPGTVAGVTALEAADAVELPTALLAVTVKV